MKNTKISLFVLFLAISSSVMAQSSSVPDKIKGKTYINIGTAINSHSYLQGNNKLYKEISLDYGFWDFIYAGIYIGHQKRDYTFLSNHPETEWEALEYSQTLVPLGIRGTIMLTPLLKYYFNLETGNKLEWYLTCFGGK